MSQKRTHNMFSKTRQNIALGFLALVAVLLCVYALRPAAPNASPEQVAEANAANEQRTKERQAKAEAVAAIPVVAFLGDSYTFGTGADDPANRWTTVLAKDQGWTEKNFGAGGTSYATGSAQTGGKAYTERLADVVASRPDIVIISGGANSYTVDQSDGITEVFSTLRAELPNAEIVALSPFWWNEEYPARLAAVSALVESGVESVGGTFVDLGHPLAGHLNLLGEDGVHPTSEGYAYLADDIRGELPDSLTVALTAP